MPPGEPVPAPGTDGIETWGPEPFSPMPPRIPVEPHSPSDAKPPGEARNAPNPWASARLRTFLATLVVIAVLALGRPVLVPIALAGVLAFLLAPLAAGIERLHVPRGIASGISTLVLIGV